jgi:hypothetical protein
MTKLVVPARPSGAGVLFAACLFLSIAPRTAHGTAQPTGSLATARYGHTATPLGDGRVLVAGGYGPGGQRLSSAEIYDPATGAFTPTSAMATARSGHTATYLTVGRVLVVGGTGDSGTLSSCELYEPLRGTWTPTESLSTPRREHTATLVENGEVLVVGGQNGLTPLETGEIWDYDSGPTGRWSNLGSALSVARFGHAAARLTDGSVLIAGGQTQVVPAAYTATAVRWLPGTREFVDTDPMLTSRRSFTLTLRQNGSVVAAGGRNASGTLSSAERYVQSTGWSGLPDLPSGRSGHSAALLPDDRVLLSGAGAGAAATVLDEFDLGLNNWAAVETVAARSSHTVTLLPGGRVLFVGGLDAGGAILASAEIVDRMPSFWTTVGTAWGRADGTLTVLPNGKVLVLGKALAGDTTRGSLYDPGNDTWAFTAGTMVVPRSEHTATLLADGRVLIVGGVDVNRVLATKDELYDPATETFAETPAIPSQHRMREHNAVLLADGRVLVGGVWASGTYFAGYIWSPATAAWSFQAGPPSVSSSGTRLVALANGKVLFTNAYTDAWLFDPSPGGGWTETGGRNGNYVSDVILLPDGDVLFCENLVQYSVYDVETGRFRTPFPEGSGAFPTTSSFRATALPDGRVVLTGGANYNPTAPVTAAAILDPATGVTTALWPMGEARESHATVLLPDGRILVSGGRPTGGIIPSAEVLRPWRFMLQGWRPSVTDWPSSLAQPAVFDLAGSGFRGISEASGGNGGAASSAGSPAVLLRRLDGGISRWMTSSWLTEWRDNRFVTGTVSGLPAGHYAATVFASGKPSISRAISVTGCELTTGVLASTSAASVCQGQPLTLTAKDVPGATYTWTLPDGSTEAGRILTVPGAQPADGGLYTVVATKGGCPSPPDSVLVRVAPFPEVPVLDAPSSIYVGAVGEASVEEHVGSTYAWTVTGANGTYWEIDPFRIRFLAPATGGTMKVRVVETVGASCPQPLAEKTIVVEDKVPTRFHPVTPCRLLDTRESSGASAAAPALGADETRWVVLPVHCGIPLTTARSLSVNQTVTQPAAAGDLVVYRGDLETAPVTSNVSFGAGKTRANNGILEISRDAMQAIRIRNRSAGTVHFILDVNGYFE